MRDPREVVIVGSGPSGYTAAIYTARAGLSPLLFEGSLGAGGALMNTTEVENFPGFPEGVQGPDLMAAMRAQALRFGAELITDDVLSLDLRGDIKRVVDSEENVHEAKTIILATGSAYRTLGIPDEGRLNGRGVSYCATCDGFFFRGKDIAVVGGGDTALEEANFLSRFGNSVTVVHRRGEFRASQVMVDRAKANPKIHFALESVVTQLHGENQLESVTLTDTLTGGKRELAVQGLFVAIGHIPRSELVRGQVDLDGDGYVKVASPSTSTNLAGVFATGDLVDRTYRQAITAAASGCRAALDVERYLEALL
ncbi:MAG: thioredoxin-disulfide reductase [Propionibacteriaceae bacterium]|jgi:thioredoxin reductase (NADPH)|nr:thioredoxin-disulfide reductase [Propionibacteriaceae bacterium]